MNIQSDKYIILEIIPTNIKSKNGKIIQLSALKIEGLKLLDRFDYRVKDELIDNIDVLNIIQYDKNMFNYVDNIYFIPEKFKQFVEDLPLLVLDDTYTLDFLSYLDNKKELVYPYLDIEFSLDVIDRLKDKYNLEDSNHLVDLIYESLIFNTK